jgi:hypothetical protein
VLAQHLNERLELYSLLAGSVLETCHRSGHLVVGSSNHDSNPRCGRGRALVIEASVDARRSAPDTGSARSSGAHQGGSPLRHANLPSHRWASDPPRRDRALVMECTLDNLILLFASPAFGDVVVLEFVVSETSEEWSTSRRLIRSSSAAVIEFLITVR